MIGPRFLPMASAAALAGLTLAMWAALSFAAPPGRTVPVPTSAHLKVSGTSAVMMMANGETGTFQCTCNKGQGACKLVRLPSSMICDNPGGAGACTGECVFFTSTTGATGAAATAARARGSMSRAP